MNTRLLPLLLVLAACGGESRAVAATDSSAMPAMPSAIPALPTVGPQVADSGPGFRVERGSTRVRLVMEPNEGDQINALQPPVITTTDARKIVFTGVAVTADSAYFVGDVIADIAADSLPVEGTLTTSYCRKGESLCRSAKRPVNIR